MRLFIVFLVLLAFVPFAKAQQIKSDSIFGYDVPKKIKTDSSKNNKCFRPAYLRLGIIGGALFPLSSGRAGSSFGLRAQLGFNNRYALVGDMQFNHGQSTTYPNRQMSLAVHWSPYKSVRWQPYFGAGFGFGGNGNKNNDYRHGGYLANDGNSGTKVLALARVGLNTILARRIIATVETQYQAFSNFKTGSSLGLRIGLSYQFGKKK